MFKKKKKKDNGIVLVLAVLGDNSALTYGVCSKGEQ